MSTNQILFGLALVLALAVGSQLVARRLRIPALVILLPVGFLAGAVTGDIDPNNLLGALYQPIVTIAVGVILFEAGLRLSFDEVATGTRRVVVRLVAIGGLVSWVAIAPSVALAFLGPAGEVRALLKWEGVLVDPVGALLGVVVFTGVSSGNGWRPGTMLLSLGVGGLVGLVGAAMLWLLLREVQWNAPRMVVPA